MYILLFIHIASDYITIFYIFYFACKQYIILHTRLFVYSFTLLLIRPLRMDFPLENLSSHLLGGCIRHCVSCVVAHESLYHSKVHHHSESPVRDSLLFDYGHASTLEHCHRTVLRE